MAISDVYTVEDFSLKVQEIISEIGSIGDVTIRAKNKLDEQIREAKKIEKEVLDILNCSDMKKLNERLKNFSEATINFNGINLNTIFVSGMRERNAINLDRFNKAVTYFIEYVVKSESTVNQISDISVNFLVNYLNQTEKNIHVQYSSSKGYDKKTGNYIPISFTDEQKNAWKERMIEWARKESGNPYLKEKGAEEYIITKFSGQGIIETEIKDVFDWGGKIHYLSQNEAKEKYKEGSKKLLDINNLITEEILKYVPKDKDLIKSIIQHILHENQYAFFVGKNANDITGLLGEIQAIYYISKLIDENGNKIDESIVKWRGGTYTGDSNTKPHQDILIKNLFGVQVKNSSREEAEQEILKHNYKVNFSDAQFNTIIQKMRMEGLDDNAANLVEDYYSLLSFNIPYHYSGRKKNKKAIFGNKYYKKAVIWNEATRIYKKSRGILESRQKNINILLKSFITALMYIQYSKDIKITDKNILFFIGAASAISAVDILKELKEEIAEEESHFQVKASLPEDNFTIIDAINNGQLNSATSFGKNNVQKIILTSSIRF